MKARQHHCLYCSPKQSQKPFCLQVVLIPLVNFSCLGMINYSEEPKTVTSFDLLTFFRVGINQSDVEDSFQLASDLIKSARNNANKSKAVTFLGSLL